MFSNITRGGQTLLHRLRMFKQVVKTTLISSVGIGLIVVACTIWNKIPGYIWYQALAYGEAQILVNMPFVSSDKLYKITQTVRTSERRFKVRSIDVIHDADINHNMHYIFSVSKTALWYGVSVSIGLFFMVLLGWFWQGKRQKRSRHIRGARLTTAKGLKWAIRLRLKSGPFKFAGVPLLKKSETGHILLSGTTRSGKTTALNQLLDQVREKGQRAVVVDTTGDCIKRFYRAGKDIILNPFDARCEPWNIWSECLEEPHYDKVVESLIQDDSGTSDKFWVKASRVVVAELLREMKKQGVTSNLELARHLFLDKVSELEQFLEKTCAARFTAEEADKMSYSVLANFIAPMQFIKYLPDAKHPFSIRKWVGDQKQDSWIFITAKKDHLDTLSNVISFFLDMTINSLITLPENRQRRLWFVIDELAALKELKCLPQILSEGGKYGGCVVSAFQSIPSLYKIYDYNGAKALLNCFNTRVFFRNKDSETCNYISDSFGEAEVIEFQENHSYGAHEMRDGTNINYVHRMKKIVLPSEIIGLDDLHAFYQVPGHFPVAKIQFALTDEKAITDPYVPIQQKIEIFSKEDLQNHTLNAYNKKSEGKTSNEQDAELKDTMGLRANGKATKIFSGYIKGKFLIVRFNKKRTYKIPLVYYPNLEKSEQSVQINSLLSKDRQRIDWKDIGLSITVEDVLELGEKIS